MIETYILIIVSAALRALQEIAKNRPGRTWIDECFLTWQIPVWPPVLAFSTYKLISFGHYLTAFLAGAMVDDLNWWIGAKL